VGGSSTVEDAEAADPPLEVEVEVEAAADMSTVGLRPREAYLR
jgi:hypothetical protein